MSPDQPSKSIFFPFHAFSSILFPFSFASLKIVRTFFSPQAQNMLYKFTMIGCFLKIRKIHVTCVTHLRGSFKLYACSFTFNSPQLGYGTQAVCHGRVNEQKRYYHTVLHERLFELLYGCLI